jgi:hypothetical protein
MDDFITVAEGGLGADAWGSRNQGAATILQRTLSTTPTTPTTFTMSSDSWASCLNHFFGSAIIRIFVPAPHLPQYGGCHVLLNDQRR